MDPPTLQEYADRALEKQQKILAAKSRPQVDPRPGDGVCPTSEQYHNTKTRSRELWQTLIDDAKRNPVVPDLAAQFINLLNYVPAFPFTLSQQLSTLDSHTLVIECVSEWLTTNDPECGQPFKTMRHYQTLGIPEPVVYQLLSVGDIQPTSQVDDDKPVFLSLVFAWSYVLSCRWVEVLQYTGADVQLLQDKEVNAQNFWDMIRKQQWRAVFAHGNKTYLAPWSFVRSGDRLSYQRTRTSPATSFALKMLADFCTTDELYEQSIIALAVAMMLPAHLYRKAVLMPHCYPLTNLKYRDFATRKFFFFDKLSSHLDRCITLSCSPEGIDSLLCSVFFDPKVSCNLIGAQMTGITEALLPLHEDSRVLLSLMTRRCPKLTPLWAAAICTGKVEYIFRKSAGGTPPLELPVASWTGVVESFIQVHYSSDVLSANELLRSEEWRYKYLITAERLPPHAPSPPFGKTNKCNLNIDVRKHLGHDHKLLSYRMYWILKTGEKLPAQTSPINMYPIDVVLEVAAPRSWSEGNSPTDNAENGSCNATFNIFIWLQNLEEGLWLRSGSESSGDAREVMRHRWITEEEEDDDEVLKDGQHKKEHDFNRVQEWVDNIT